MLNVSNITVCPIYKLPLNSIEPPRNTKHSSLKDFYFPSKALLTYRTRVVAIDISMYLAYNFYYERLCRIYKQLLQFILCLFH